MYKFFLKQISRLSYFFVFLFLSNLCFAGAQGDLTNILNSIGSIQADFSQSVYDGKHKLLKQLTGTMMIMRPNHFRWEINAPIQQLTIADGKYIYVYDPNLKQVTQQAIKKGKTVTPAMILSDSSKGILNDFFTTKKNEWFILQPKLGDMVKSVALKFSGNKLTSMQILDGLDQTTVIQFSNIQLNQNIAKSKFTFTVPAGADVVKVN